MSWNTSLRSDSIRSESFTGTPRGVSRSASKPQGRVTDDGGRIPAATDASLTPSEANKRPATSRPSSATKNQTTPQMKPPLPAVFKTPRPVPKLYISKAMSEGSPMEDSPRHSLVSNSDLPHAEEFSEEDSVQVFVRVRPCNTNELIEEAAGREQEPPCIRVVGESAILASIPGREPKRYTYDKVLPESSMQIDVFEAAGIPMVDNCVSGYNSSIFVYGQTGAGKTHTMMGELNATTDQRSDERGLAPRVIELLFEKIGLAEDSVGRDALRYSCRCSCLELYNENITDLLLPSSTNLVMREDPIKGIYVDGLIEKEVLNGEKSREVYLVRGLGTSGDSPSRPLLTFNVAVAEDVMALMFKGQKNRHVGETKLNATSSRSHCVFTCVVERTSKNTANGVTSVVGSRLNLIDLAGSERVKGGALGGSQAQGDHFKEAVNINRSLSTLGRVISALVEAQNEGQKGQHIPYRDSKLTFLLQDSLGGNAKTTIIANVSPSPLCTSETVSTLNFVSSAKCIRNKATINLNYRGDVAMLNKEIVRLNVELDNLRKGFTDPAIRENKELRERIFVMEKQHVENELRISSITNEKEYIKKDRQRLEARLESIQEGVVSNEVKCDLAEQLEKVEKAEKYYHDIQQKALESFASDLKECKLQVQLTALDLQAAHSSAHQQNVAWEAEREGLAMRAALAAESIQSIKEELKTAKNKADEAEQSNASLAILYAEVREGLESEQACNAEIKASCSDLTLQIETLKHLQDAAKLKFDRERQVHLEAQVEAASQVAGLRQQLEVAATAALHQAEDMAAAKVTFRKEEALKCEAVCRAEGLTQKVALLEQELLDNKQQFMISENLSTKLQKQIEDLVRSRNVQQQEVQHSLCKMKEELDEVRQAREAAETQSLRQEEELIAIKQATGLSEKQNLRQQEELHTLKQGKELAETQNLRLQEELAELKQAKELSEKQNLRQEEELHALQQARELSEELNRRQQEELHALKQDRESAEALSLRQQEELSALKVSKERSDVDHAHAVAQLCKEVEDLAMMVEKVEDENNKLKSALTMAQEDNQEQQASADRLLQQSQVQALAISADLQKVEFQLVETKREQEIALARANELKEQIKDLQMEMIRNKELHGASKSEFDSKSKQLSEEIDRIRLEQSSTQLGLEAKCHEVKELQSILSQRDIRLIDLEKTIQAANEIRMELEQEVKGHLVEKYKLNQALSEIRKLIKWASPAQASPPTSTRSSLLQGQGSATSLGLRHHEMPSPGSGLTSPSDYSGLSESEADYIESPSRPREESEEKRGLTTRLNFDIIDQHSESIHGNKVLDLSGRPPLSKSMIPGSEEAIVDDVHSSNNFRKDQIEAMP